MYGAAWCGRLPVKEENRRVRIPHTPPTTSINMIFDTERQSGRSKRLILNCAANCLISSQDGFKTALYVVPNVIMGDYILDFIAHTYESFGAKRLKHDCVRVGNKFQIITTVVRDRKDLYKLRGLSLENISFDHTTILTLNEPFNTVLRDCQLIAKKLFY